ncbi:MAG TPA: DUF881 domain-containing protein [Syntrophomonadaceae bacterium]|nr:DUF881 domain-containing protein [Syntrophomonadaceae bacterium]
MKNNEAIISIAAVCLILGIMISIQFKSTQAVGINMSPARVTELTDKLDKANEEREVLVEEVLELREKLKNVREFDIAMADLQTELQTANMAAGGLEIEGPGITLTLDDSARGLKIGEDPNDLLIHDYDILIIVNELKASGAEAISVNGERITAMSEIRCAGTLILVNWVKIAPPFVIKAIGNPDMLESGLNMKGGYLQTLKALVQVNLQKSEDINIPAYSGRTKFSYGSPVQFKEKADE